RNCRPCCARLHDIFEAAPPNSVTSRQRTSCKAVIGFADEAAKNGSAMAMAIMGKAKILGLILDRREVGEVGAFDHLTDEQLIEEANKMADKLGLPRPKLD